MTLKERQALLSEITLFINGLPIDDEAVKRNEAASADKVELLTIKECAGLISGLSEHTVRQLVAQGKLPHIRSGAGKRGKILIPKAALIEYLKK